MDHNRVPRWLRAVPDDGGGSARKRARPSDGVDVRLPAGKRRRIGFPEPAAAQEDQTPRPRRPFRRAAAERSVSPANLPSSIPSHVSSSNTSSEASGSDASAGNKRQKMQLGPDPVMVEPFGGLATRARLLPKALNALLLDFDLARYGGLPFISHSRRDEIRRSRLAGRSIHDHHFMPDDGGGAGQPQAESPSLEDVTRIVQTAHEYTALGYNEHAWKSGVHFPLLRLAIPDQNSLLKIVQCTTERISSKQFLPEGMPNDEMVDFCLAIDPHWPLGRTSPTPASKAVDELRLSQPGNSISHTTYQPLARYPIALSITTKLPQGSSEDAEAQLGVWQTAQWRMLEAMVVCSQGSDAGHAARPAAAGPSARLGELGFLPGIYTVGNLWRFAATTRDQQSGRTTLWTESDFGSTTNVLGVYRIIWGLRRLEKFLTEIYWPWFQKCVLGMEESDAEEASRSH
ncbi:hypothetical protein MAPG_10703 [Magnaporthiopsis poae ATCC 64411]|uniref:PD-(D/E)XK nuclease-like domain-containing protein n=1 Tax=Magnaporthiopsis poae (strain ATCC 64411 / 73-15) TaxID=644358 RepID=A0A0C4EDA8_MAGP6|nr:hypothetical protein MAPG_10703 [Magnaporthiopsis poae ATCC 64411]